MSGNPPTATLSLQSTLVRLVNEGDYRKGEIDRLIRDLKTACPWAQGYKAEAIKRYFRRANIKLLKGGEYRSLPRTEGYLMNMTQQDLLEDLRRALWVHAIDQTPRHDYVLIRTAYGGSHVIAPRIKNLEHPDVFECAALDHSLVMVFARNPEAVERVHQDLLAISKAQFDGLGLSK